MGCPCVRVLLALKAGGPALPLFVQADTGAGTSNSGFDLILRESDCQLGVGVAVSSYVLSGALTGSFPVHLLQVLIPELKIDRFLHVVAVPATTPGFDGVASFQFLNRFTYGNFGDPGQFGLEI
jgi:hypothetical protein